MLDQSIAQKWEQFRKTGLLWWTNKILHIFGWQIVFIYENKEGIYLDNVYPERTINRGFVYDLDEKGFKDLTLYMADNALKLKEEVLQDAI